MSSKLKEESAIRTWLIEKNLVEAVIVCPDNMFASTSIGTCILLLDKNKTTATTEMVDLRRKYDEEVREQNGQYGGSSHTNRTYKKTFKVITEETMDETISAIEERKNIQGFCKSVSIEKMKEDKYTLLASHYIDIEETVSMRTKAGMLERVKSGLWMGGGRVPFGYYYDRNDGILHPKEDEAEKVRTMYRLYNDGYSCQKISDMLGMKGERIVIQILKRKSNIGYIEYKGNTYKGKHEAIIDEETFYKTQRFMEKRSNNSYICNKFLLSGLCFCGKCGARMRYKKWANRHVLECYSRDGYKEYMVKNPNCNNKRPDAKDVEKEVSDCFKRFAVNITGRHEKQLSKKELIEKEMKSTVDKLKKLYELYATNESETLLEVIGKSEKRVKELRRELDRETRKKSLTTPERIEKIKKISDVWDKLDVKEQNKVLKECIDKIVITDGNIDIYFNLL